MSKIVAIHQPNFFPWLGYFDKIAKAEHFVFLDDVQFPKTGGVWTNRVKLIIGGKESWFTALIDRQYHGTKNINEMYFNSNIGWRKKLLKNLEYEYRKHPFFEEVMEVISPLLMNPENNIAEYNIHAVTTIAEVLSLDTGKLSRSSSYSFTSMSNELLCMITNTLGGNTYMCGSGASGYQDENYFTNLGINLKYQNFQHPIYPQRGKLAFVPGLSVIDAAMNIGWHQCRLMFSSFNS